MQNKLLYKFNQQSWTVLKQLMLEVWDVSLKNKEHKDSQKMRNIIKAVLKNNEMTFTQWKALNVFKKLK
jgi:S-adenosylmethionine/arginine decarboxylase-like enzyme